MTALRGVHVLFTGGTISMRVDPATGAAVPALSGEEIAALVPGLRNEARLTLEDYSRLPGPHVTPAWMWRLRGRVRELLREAGVDAVVVTHGTDTLEETAFLLDLTLVGEKPVVFCGAMRTVSDPGWDGPANLRAAVRTAAHPDARGHGVLVAMGELVHGASEATKWHTESLNAFRSAHGAVAVLDRGTVIFQRPPSARRVLEPESLVTEVDLHVMVAGSDDGLIAASLLRGARGLVIAGTGCGNVPPLALPGILRAISGGVPVVLATRCAEGPVSPAYGYEGGGLRLREMGLISGGELSGPKARLKLMAALGVSTDVARIREIFEA